MTLKIERGRAVKDMQQHFNAIYPYLTIEFVKRVSGREEVMHSHELFQCNAALINIDKKQTVARLEEDFLNKAGLKVKVYRRFCNVWIEATLTDDWTLEQQNNEGQLLSELNKATV